MPKLSDLLWDYVPDKQAFQGMGNDLLAAANRGGVAAVLGAPVDITNQLANLGKALYGYVGNKAGLLSADQMPQLDERPIGGSEWIGQKMQDAGLINGNRNHLAELLTGMVMPGAMLKGGVKANQALDAAITNAQRPGTLNTPGYKGQRGATVWHGSPHDIQPKPGGKYPEFDMSKIGTGEGAQAYGHGLYMAEAQGVAKDNYMIPATWSSRPKQWVSNTGSILNKKISDFLDAMHSRQETFSMPSKADFEDVASLYGAKNAETLKKILTEHNPHYGYPKGYLYKVDIPDEAIPRMLDWDKPLSQQAPEVQAYFADKVAPIKANAAQTVDGWGDLSAPFNYDPTGNELLSLLRNGRQNAGSVLNNGLDSAVSAQLNQAGIPGIRYLDGGSRGAGQGTSNYVLFDDKLPRILEKNGVPTGQTPWTPEEWAAYLSGGGR